MTMTPLILKLVVYNLTKHVYKKIKILIIIIVDLLFLS